MGLVGACAVYGNHAFLGCGVSGWFGGLFKWKFSRLQSSRAATATKASSGKFKISSGFLITIILICFMSSETSQLSGCKDDRWCRLQER